MKRMLKIAVICFIVFFKIPVLADGIDSLTLTDAEMQKLKKYFPADDSAHLVWKGDPILVSLPLGKEKRLIFPDTVSIDLKGTLNTDQLRVINNNKSLYLTALKYFSTTRIYVTLQDSGEVLLIDLITDNDASSTSQQIDMNKKVISGGKVETTTLVDTAIDPKIMENLSYVDLIRFAWQQVYAPTRLLDKNLHFQRTPMQTQQFVPDLVYGDKVIAHPAGSWISGTRYVTAVLLRNKYFHRTKVNIAKDVCGNWVAATLYPRSILQPYGFKDKDSALLFLISNRPFGKMLGVCHGDA